MSRTANGSGSIRKKANGRYEARYYTQNRERRARTFDRKVDAQRFLNKALTEVTSGTHRDPRDASVPFSVAWDEWTESWGDLKPSTRHRYAGAYSKHLGPQFGPVRLASIDTSMVQRWVNELSASGSAPGNVDRTFSMLRTALTYAVKVRKRLVANPCEGVRLPRVPKRKPMCLEAHQVALLADEMPARYRALIWTAAYTGARFGELAGLTTSSMSPTHIAIERAVTRVDGEMIWGTPKNHQSRRLSIPPFLAELLAEHIATYANPEANYHGDPLVFATSGGKPLGAPAIHAAFKRSVRNSLPPELAPFRFHDLRHTCASLLIAAGAHPKAISTRLGHASIAITMDRYGHLLPSLDDALTDALQVTFQSAAASPPRLRAV